MSGDNFQLKKYSMNPISCQDLSSTFCEFFVMRREKHRCIWYSIFRKISGYLGVGNHFTVHWAQFHIFLYVKKQLWNNRLGEASFCGQYTVTSFVIGCCFDRPAIRCSRNSYHWVVEWSSTKLFWTVCLGQRVIHVVRFEWHRTEISSDICFYSPVDPMRFCNGVHTMYLYCTYRCL